MFGIRYVKFPPTTFVMQFHNGAVVREGTGRAARINGLAAGKTGTSQGYRDAWFVGFTSNMIVGVWVGNDDNGPTRNVTGGDLPARIWNEFVTQSVAARQKTPRPQVAANRGGYLTQGYRIQGHWRNSQSAQHRRHW